MWDTFAIGSGVGRLAAVHPSLPDRRRACGLLAPAAMLLCALAPDASAQAESRGQLLYSTHCVACHTSQMHWRDHKLAIDQASLRAQVKRWQATAMLAWTDSDIAEVTRYLNERYYHFAPAVGAQGSVAPLGRGPG